jgi:hypothetical protein
MQDKEKENEGYAFHEDRPLLELLLFDFILTHAKMPMSKLQAPSPWPSLAERGDAAA